jgi:hypothetical protein
MQGQREMALQDGLRPGSRSMPKLDVEPGKSARSIDGGAKGDLDGYGNHDSNTDELA